jgi:hypothetical protein
MLVGVLGAALIVTVGSLIYIINLLMDVVSK